jgi:hypothetical protein
MAHIVVMQMIKPVLEKAICGGLTKLFNNAEGQLIAKLIKIFETKSDKMVEELTKIFMDKLDVDDGPIQQLFQQERFQDVIENQVKILINAQASKMGVDMPELPKRSAVVADRKDASNNALETIPPSEAEVTGAETKNKINSSSHLPTSKNSSAQVMTGSDQVKGHMSTSPTESNSLSDGTTFQKLHSIYLDGRRKENAHARVQLDKENKDYWLKKEDSVTSGGRRSRKQHKPLIPRTRRKTGTKTVRFRKSKAT